MPKERANGGKFLPGHSIKSPGRPKKEKVEDVNYLGLLRECVTEDDHRAIIRRALVDAKNGSRHAREWIYKHLMPVYPRLSTLEFSVMEPSDRKNDGTDIATDEFRMYVDCMTPEEFEMFLDVSQRVKDVKAGLLIRPKYDITKLVPAGSISKEQEWKS